MVNDKVPKVTIKGQSGPPWIDSKVRHLHKVKHTAWCRAKRSNKSRDWSSCKKYRNKLKNNIKAKHKAFMAGIGQAVNHNPKRFRSYCKSKTRQTNIPQTVKLNSVTSSDNNEKCNMFNAHFHSSFSPCLKTDDELPHINVKYDNYLSAVNFSGSVYAFEQIRCLQSIWHRQFITTYFKTVCLTTISLVSLFVHPEYENWQSS